MAKRTAKGSTTPVFYGVARPGISSAVQVIAWFSTRAKAESAKVQGTVVVEGERLWGEMFLLRNGR